jgi:arginine-tRNA-protein transferase
MSVINKIKLYSTAPHPCSYLDEREATTLFLDPNAEIDEPAYRELNQLGFRRSGQHFYKPHCKNCDDCIAARISVEDFKPSRRQKRTLRKNADLKATDVSSIQSDEHFALYEKYISQRHAEGDMYPPSHEQYMQFIGDAATFSRYTEFRLNGHLIAVSVQDVLADSVSAIYTFFDPDSKRSLGSHAILVMIERARQELRDYIYLGYWVRECQKMAYKVEYRPIQLRINGRWQTLL